MMVVCGEALMDVFADADTPTGMVLDGRVGGSPFNVAAGVARLAQPVSFFGALSHDFLGERLLRALRDEGVETASIARVNAPTTLGLVGTAVPVPVVDTLGAGDSFQAALLTWLAEHDCCSAEAMGSMSALKLREALRFAARAASITCSRRGADLPRRCELERSPI